MPEWTFIAEAAALLSSLAFGVRNIFIRKALPYTTSLVSSLAVTAFTVLFFIPWTWMQRPGPPITWLGLLWLILAGVSAPGLALLFYFASVNRIGVARSTPLASVQSFVSLIVAVLFLGERPDFPVYIGTFLVVGGIAIVTSEREEFRWTAREVALPLLAATFWGLSSIFRKLGMNAIPWPTFSALIMSAAGLTTHLCAYRICAGRAKRSSQARAAPLLLAAGACLAAGFYLNLFAFMRGTVATIGPLSSTSPIMTLLLAAIFLRRLEKVTWRLMICTAVIVVGCALITAN